MVPSNKIFCAAITVMCVACSSTVAESAIGDEDLGQSTGGVESDPGDASASDDDGHGDDDGGPESGADVTCSLWAQDCDPGHKCTVVLDAHGDVLETRCVALLDDASSAGEPCTSVGAGADTCDVGTVCYHLDAGNQGTCISLCIGSPDDPTCPDDDVGEDWGTECLATESACPVPLCLARCHPFEVDPCGKGQLCVPKSRSFVCETDTSDAMLVEGDSCSKHAECGEGMACVGSSYAPCSEGDACCTRYCDIADDEPCADAQLPGLDCMAWPGFGPDALDGYATVGICGLQ